MAGSLWSVTTKTRKPLGSVIVAAFGKWKGRGAPGPGICGASFTPGGTTPEAFCGSVLGASVWLREALGACSCAKAAGANAATGANEVTAAATPNIVAAKNEMPRCITRFIITPR